MRSSSLLIVTIGFYFWLLSLFTQRFGVSRIVVGSLIFLVLLFGVARVLEMHRLRKSFARLRGERTSQSRDLEIGASVKIGPRELIPADGVVVNGVCVVDESVITGESAPVIREAVTERKFVTAGSRVISGSITIKVTHAQGSGFIDGLKASLAPKANRAAILTTHKRSIGAMTGVSLTSVFITLALILMFGASRAAVEIGVLASTLFISTGFIYIEALTALSSLIMKRCLELNLVPKTPVLLARLAKVNVLIFDKTGTLTFGNRKATQFFAFPGSTEEEVAQLAQAASLGDETPEGRSIVVLAKRLYRLRGALVKDHEVSVVAFDSSSQLSGINIFDQDGDAMRTILKGSPAAIRRHVERLGGRLAKEVDEVVDSISRGGATPLLICHGMQVVGAVNLTDKLRSAPLENFSGLHELGVRTILMTGDHPVTSAGVARELEIDAIVAGATPKRKLEVVREQQRLGHVVAIVGDGVNDAPAMLQAEISIALNSGAHLVRESSNIIDLQSHPFRFGKLIRLSRTYRKAQQVLQLFLVAGLVYPIAVILFRLFESPVEFDSETLALGGTVASLCIYGSTFLLLRHLFRTKAFAHA